jgi:hypothetical protein
MRGLFNQIARCFAVASLVDHNVCQVLRIVRSIKFRHTHVSSSSYVLPGSAFS